MQLQIYWEQKPAHLDSAAYILGANNPAGLDTVKDILGADIAEDLELQDY